MKIMMVSGGSGGHIYPCLELAKYFRSKGEEILLAGCKDSMEEKVYLSNNFNFKGIKIGKKRILSYFKNYQEINHIYNEFKPDLVFLFGNYISASFGISAIIKRIPIYLHEQNVIYGMANKVLAIKAKKIYLSLPIKNNFYKYKSVLVGNPKADIEVERIYLNHSLKQVVIAMGSLGSTSINKIIKEFIKICNPQVQYHIVIGNKYYKEFIKDLKIKDNVKLYPYLDNLSSYLKECDLFVSRAGATTISEIISFSTPSILIPSPYVKNNHQFKNAKYLFKNNACLLLKENCLDAKTLNNEINNLLSNDKKRFELKNNLIKLKVNNTKQRIYEDIKNDNK